MANSSMIKDRKYMPPIQEIAIVDNQATYPINSSSIEGLEFLSRKPNEKFYIMVKDANYTLEQVSGVWNITIINTDLLEAITDIQVASALTIESGEYDPIGSVDIVTLKDYYNKLYRDFINLQSFYNINSFLTDGLTDNLVLPSLKPNETWVMNVKGEVVTTPIGIINDSVEKLLEDFKKELDDFTEEQKVELDIFNEEQKTELNNFTEEQKNEVIIVADAKIEEINNIILDNAGNGLVKVGNTINVGTANDGIIANADNIQLDTQNVLTSTAVNKPLSANMGKVLQDTKLDLTGGTLTGILNGTSANFSGNVKNENLAIDASIGHTVITGNYAYIECRVTESDLSANFFRMSSDHNYNLFEYYGSGGLSGTSKEFIRHNKSTGVVTYAGGNYGTINGSTATFSGNVTAPSITIGGYVVTIV